MEIHDDELYHWGIFGMKWGVRRYQNPDGTLTPEGRKRYRKSAKEMTDEELISAINRLANEKRYTDLVKSMEPEHLNTGKKILAGISKGAKIAGPVLAPFGKAYTHGMEKLLTNAIDQKFVSDEERAYKKLTKENDARKAVIEQEKLIDEMLRIQIGRRDNGTSRHFDNNGNNGNKDGNKNNGSNNDSNKQSQNSPAKSQSLMDRLIADSDDVTLAELKAFDYT